MEVSFFYDYEKILTIDSEQCFKYSKKSPGSKYYNKFSPRLQKMRPESDLSGSSKGQQLFKAKDLYLQLMNEKESQHQSVNDFHHYIQWGHSLSPHLDLQTKELGWFCVGRLRASWISKFERRSNATFHQK